MPLIRGQVLSGTTDRTYHIQVPATPPQATVPAIVVFHGGGQDVTEIARRWGVDPRTRYRPRSRTTCSSSPRPTAG